jgi:hypothetical protein
MPPRPTLKFLLDEHVSKTVAAALRQAGVDAVSVAERPDLRGQPDTGILAAADGEGRVVVTGDCRTFPAAMAATDQWLGVVFFVPARFAGRSGQDRLRAALARLAADPPLIWASPGFTWWLNPDDATPDLRR